MATAASPGAQAVEEFVTKLNDRMEALGITPAALAKKAKVGCPYLYRVLKGEQTPSIDWAAKVGKQVGLRIATIEANGRGKKTSG
jgi:predicted transcriptional regulator